MKNLLISEILEKASKAQTKAEKISVLKAYDCLALRDVVRGALDNRIQWNLPVGAPKFESGENHTDGSVPSDLKRRTNEFRFMVKGSADADRLHPARREAIFLGLLESVHPTDAEMLIAMKDKKFSERYPGITKNLVKEIWPKLVT